MSVKYLYLAAVAAIMGCASAAGTHATARTGNVLTAEDIAANHADIETAYDAVVRLRPNWLAPHGVTSAQAGGAGTERAAVFVDGQLYGDVSSLRNIPAYHVRELRYYNVTEAGARFGIKGGSSGAIDVTMNLASGSND
jgi:hypothetical protein